MFDVIFSAVGGSIILAWGLGYIAGVVFKMF